MTSRGIEAVGDGTYRISGRLTFDTVEELRAGARQAVPPGRWREETLTFDLGAVEQADSAGLALLVEWRRAARREGGRIHFRAIPRALRSIAGLCGIAGALFETESE